MTTPQNVLDAISKLESEDQAVVKSYIDELQSKIPVDDVDESENEQQDAEEEPVESEPVESEPVESEPVESEQQTTPNDDIDLPMYQSGEDYDKATDLKMEAADLKNAGDYAGALEKYNLAITAAPPSALLMANRADTLLRLEHYDAAVRDCDAALEKNPDSAKALRIRGRSYKALGEFEKSRKDLSASQTIDYDDVAAEDLKFVTDKVKEMDAEKVKTKLEEEEKLRKRAEEIRKAQQEARREAEEEEKARAASMPGMGGMPGGMGGMPGMGGMGGMPGGMGGMPGMPGGMGGMPGGMGGMPGGMGGMPGMGGIGDLLNDPELAAGLQNPKIMATFTSMMSGGGPDMSKIQELMADPETAPFMTKLMSKLGGMGGMGGGGPMGGMGGSPMGGMGGDDDDDDDDMPDLDDLPDLE